MKACSVIGLLFAAAIFAAIPISPQATPRGLELSVHQAQAVTYGRYRRVHRRAYRRAGYAGAVGAGYYGAGYGGYYGQPYSRAGYSGYYNRQPVGGGGGQWYYGGYGAPGYGRW